MTTREWNKRSANERPTLLFHSAEATLMNKMTGQQARARNEQQLQLQVAKLYSNNHLSLKKAVYTSYRCHK